MSVYLDRSPYYESRYRASSVRRSSRRNNNAWMPKLRKRQRRVSGVLAQEYIKTGQTVRKSARFFSEMVGAVKNIKGGKQHFEISMTMVISMLGMVSIMLSLGYLAHFTQVSTKGYELKRLQADRQQLLSQYEIKNMKLAEAKSLTNIVSSESIENMRKPGSVDYIQGGAVLASR